VSLVFPKAQLSQVLAVYETLIEKPVYVGASLANTTVSVATKEDFPRSKAAEFIRASLRQNHGIELVATEDAVFTVGEKYKAPDQ